MIEAKDIRKSFEGTEVLRGISTVFERGKTNLIIGQSGAGKTVFLKTLTGLIKPDSGDIYYDGVAYSSMDETQRENLRHEIGMVFQGGALFDSMSVGENVMFPLMMFSEKNRGEMEDRVQWALHRVNLDGVQAKYPSELSGGMRKRVAIARGIIMNPKYLFCDEPNSGLDPKTSKRGSGTFTTPTLGSMVQNGKLADCAFALERQLNKVDLPTLGNPTIPHFILLSTACFFLFYCSGGP